MCTSINRKSYCTTLLLILNQYFVYLASNDANNNKQTNPQHPYTVQNNKIVSIDSL